MRHSRIKADGAGYYHCMSRIIEQRMILGKAEKERFLKLMFNLAAFGDLSILTYCVMTNHFHILIHVPQRQDVTDDVLIRRLRFIMPHYQVELIARQLHDYRSQSNDAAAESLKNQFTYRMYDISEFFKALKQQFSQFYNAGNDRRGPLWEQRFKSVLVEPSVKTLLTVAAYIDLNPIRAGLTSDPKDYRFSGYGAAVGGSMNARLGLRQLMSIGKDRARISWGDIQRTYRRHLYMRGQQKGRYPEGRPVRQGFTPEQIQAVVKADGRLPLQEALRCRVRYFSDGLVLGSQAFVDSIFARYRSQFGPNRKSGARSLRFGDWQGLCSLRDLRLLPVSKS